MIRIRVDDVSGDRVEVVAASAHHLAHVLRVAAGDRLTAFDGRGAERPMCVAAVRADAVVLEATGAVARPASAALDITVLQALAKGDKVPRIVQAVTELGAARLQLVITRRTVSRPPADRVPGLVSRLSRIASEAARQCGRADVLEVLGPLELATCLQAELPPVRLAAWENESVTLASALPEERPAGIAVLVGPEGGLDPAEIEQIRAAGFTTVSLGPRILRTKTAAAALCAILQFRYGADGPAAFVEPGSRDI